jgi:hypothetical protein
MLFDRIVLALAVFGGLEVVAVLVVVAVIVLARVLSRAGRVSQRVLRRGWHRFAGRAE